jgi:flagellar hook-basal body complex protein FliE
MATPGIAAGAYARLARITDAAAGLSKPAGLTGAGAGDDGPNFGKMLKDAVGSVVQAGRASDAQSQAMVTGKANIVDVVTAVAETETAVQALVSVRDKMINAYEEIIRMQI